MKELLQNLSFRWKIIIMLGFPIIGLVYFSTSVIWDNYEISSDAIELKSLADLSGEISELVHQTQIERGYTAGFLSSEGTVYKTEMENQRKESDKRVTILRNTLETVNKDAYGPEFKALLATAIKSLDNLSSKRNDISQQNINSNDGIGYYTKMHSEFFDVIGYTSKISNNIDITNLSNAYANFLQAKERAGIERAVLSATFANDKFNQVNYKKFISLLAEQNTYIKVFQTYANEEQLSAYQSMLAKEASLEVERMREIALKNEDNFGIDASVWFNTSTEKINNLKSIEDQLREDLILTAESVSSSSYFAFIFYLIATIIIILLSLVFAYVIAIQSLTQLLVQVSQIGDLVASSAEEMLAKGEEMKNSTQEVSASTQQMAEGAQQQAQQTDEASKLMDDVLQSSNGMAERAALINRAAEDGQKNSIEGLTTIKLVADNMEEIQEAALSTSESIVILSERSEEIANALNVITDIAAQTNLLALNAAIEAARAGDAGRGFAVVAEEIRKLAEGSRKSAVDIEVVIREVQKGIATASNAIEAMESSVQSGTAASKEAEAVFTLIETSSKDTLNLSKRILEATDDQKETIDTSVKNIEQMVVVAEETAAGAEQVASSGQTLSLGMNEVTATSEDLANVAVQLQESIAKFKLN